MDITGRRFTRERGRIRVLDDFWERIDRVFGELDDARKRDRSFADALRHIKSIHADDRRLAVQYVEGFHAADTGVISEQALAEGGSPRDDVRERRIGRVIDGFQRVVDAMAAPILDRIQLGAVAKRVRWRRGGVDIESETQTGEPLPAMSARAVVVAIPVSLLQSDAIAFDPPLSDKQLARGELVMGNVMRVALEFDEPFWIDRTFAKRLGDERLDTMSFFHGDRTPFSVWWTTYPVKSPLLVGWCGGPNSLMLAGKAHDDIVSSAMGSLAKLLRVSRSTLNKRLKAGYMHDWISDPFSRGAYSYVAVNGGSASKRLTKPIESTIFLAGEHVDEEGRNGTVHGAIASGQEAAERIVAILQ